MKEREGEGTEIHISCGENRSETKIGLGKLPFLFLFTAFSLPYCHWFSASVQTVVLREGKLLLR